MDTQKQCLICAVHKDLKMFGPNWTGRNGLHPWCVECVRQYNRDRYAGRKTARRSIGSKRTKISREPYEQVTGVYKLTHLPTGKVYIGATIDLVRRLKQHRNELIKGKSLNKNVRALALKDGIKAFKPEILVYCSIDELEQHEKTICWEYQKKGLLLNSFDYKPGGIAQI